MGFPDRFIITPAFDASDAHFRANEPLGGGRVQLAAHNALLVAQRNTFRPLAQHPGWRDFYQPAAVPALAPPVSATAPVPGDVQWSLGPKSGGVTFCSGPHYAWPDPQGFWPKVRFTWRWAVEGGHTAGAVVVVAPEGRSVTDSGNGVNQATTTSATFSQVTLDVPLSVALVRPTLHEPVPGASTDPPEDRIHLYELRVYVGAFNSSNTDASGSRASLLGLSVFLVPHDAA